MKKFKALSVFLVLMFIASGLYAGTPSTLKKNIWRAEQTFTKGITARDFITIDGARVTANAASKVYYVRSTTGADTQGHGQGLSYDKPFATIDYAINLTTASVGDTIIVLPYHTESYSAADGFDADVAGINILGLGVGSAMPRLVFADTDATVAIGAANVVVDNINFAAGISAVVIGVAVEDAGDNFLLDHCLFEEPSVSTYEFIDAIDLESGADGVTIQNCTAFSADNTGAAHFVEAGNGVNNNLQLLNNYVYGEYSVACVWSDTTDLEVLIQGGSYTNLTNDQHAIEFVTGTALGQISNLLVRTNAQGTAVDPGSMTMHNVYWDNDTSADKVSMPVVLGSAGPASIGGSNDTTTDSIHGKIGTDTEMDDVSLYDQYVADQVDLDAILVNTAGNVILIETDATAPPSTTQTAIFTITGGPIEVLSITGEVTSTIGSTDTSMRLVADPTTPATDTDLCGFVAVEDDAVGTYYSLATSLATALQVATNGVDEGMGFTFFVPVGDIDVEANATAGGGLIVWRMRYRPLDVGVTVTAP